MRPSRRLAAALSLSLLIGGQSAQAGLFDCLHGQTITIPPIQLMPVQAPVVVQQPAAQNGLVDALVLKLIDSLITGAINGGGGSGGGGNGGGGTGGDSSSLQKANATLDRIDGKMDKLQGLIADRLSKVESDVATVAKSQREANAQIEQRLAETTNLVNENTKLIKTNADAILVNANAILWTQQQLSGGVVPPASAPLAPANKLWIKNDVKVTNLDDPKTESVLKKGTEVQKLSQTPGGKVIIRWNDDHATGSNIPEWREGIVSETDLSATK